MNERREKIRDFIYDRGEVTLAELAAAFPNWSEMTLRRDLAWLENEHQVLLTRGGARRMPSSFGLREDIYSERENRFFAEKQEIARKAVSLVEPGTGIYIDAGTTAMAFARELPDAHLAIITAAPNIALEVLLHKKQPSVIMLGGTLSREEISVSNPEVAAQLDTLNIDTAFMTASGYDETNGFTVGTHLSALLKKTVIAKARRVVMMLDSSKIGTLLPFSFARLEDVDHFVCDRHLAAADADKLKKSSKIL